MLTGRQAHSVLHARDAIRRNRLHGQGNIQGNRLHGLEFHGGLLQRENAGQQDGAHSSRLEKTQRRIRQDEGRVREVRPWKIRQLQESPLKDEGNGQEDCGGGGLERRDESHIILHGHNLCGIQRVRLCGEGVKEGFDNRSERQAAVRHPTQRRPQSRTFQSGTSSTRTARRESTEQARP